MEQQNSTPKKFKKEKKNRKTVGVDFDLDVLTTLRAMGDENDTGLGWHVRRAVAEYIERYRVAQLPI
jgi:hypothetical protein